MTVRRPPLSYSRLAWIGALGPPAAWVGQFLVLLWSTLAACGVAGARWGIPVHGWAIAATAAAAIVALLSGASALVTFFATRDAGSEPPGGRIHFLATIGIVVSVLFLFLILFNGVGAVSLPVCHQA